MMPHLKQERFNQVVLVQLMGLLAVLRLEIHLLVLLPLLVAAPAAPPADIWLGVLAVLLSATGLDFVTSVSGAATSLANVGPGLGDIIGPAGTFMPLPDAAKWLLSLGMLLGRLELFTVIVLFSRSFWRG